MTGMGFNNPLDLEAFQLEFSLLEVDSCMHFSIKMIILKILSWVFKTWILSPHKHKTAFFSKSAYFKTNTAVGFKIHQLSKKTCLSIKKTFQF
jgi:hypothetical protein